LGKQEISCIVSDCYYWSKGNACQADHILVTTDVFTANASDEVDCEISEELGPREA